MPNRLKYYNINVIKLMWRIISIVDLIKYYIHICWIIIVYVNYSIESIIKLSKKLLRIFFFIQSIICFLLNINLKISSLLYIIVNEIVCFV